MATLLIEEKDQSTVWALKQSSFIRVIELYEGTSDSNERNGLQNELNPRGLKELKSTVGTIVIECHLDFF